MANDFDRNGFGQPDFVTDTFVSPEPVPVHFPVGDVVTGQVSGYLTNDYKAFKYIGRDGETYHLPRESRNYGY